MDYIPTEVLSGNNLIQSDTFYSSMNFMNDHVHSLLGYAEKLFY
jgi:hypothetical protein